MAILQCNFKVGKYTIKSGSTKFYVTKVLTHCTDEIRSLYTQKSEINREKERKYLEFRRAELEKDRQNNFINSCSHLQFLNC